MEEQALQNFAKPAKEFLKDKECLICLEPVDIEMNQIVMLPCRCANSAYHILCIMQLLRSGQNKNFCPHCKTKYNLFLRVPPFYLDYPGPQVYPQVYPGPQVYPQVYPGPQVYEQLGTVQQVGPHPFIQNNYSVQLEQAYQSRNFSYILMVHLLSNSLMNLINIALSKCYPKYDNNPLFQVFVLFYFLKIIINFCILLYAKNDVQKIETGLAFSYLYQSIVFGWITYAVFTKIKNHSFSTILLLNNLLLGFADLGFRFIIEYRMRNRVIIMGG